jgi:hypothetical protein
MKIFNLIKRAVPKSVLTQSQTQSEWQKVKQTLYGGERELNFACPNPDLTPLKRDLNAKEVKQVNIMQAWCRRQLKQAYENLNPAVKDGK